MNKTIILVILLVISSMVLAGDSKSPVNLLIERVTVEYEKAVEYADKYYEKYTTPILKRYGDTRDKKILSAGNIAIQRLNSARRGTSELNSIKLEQEIEKIRKSLDERVGKAPKITRKVSVLAACGVKFKGHTYLAVVSPVKWEEAKNICKKMGGHLVYIETTEEMFFIEKLYGRFKMLIGATDEHKEGDWRWLNGIKVDKKFWDNEEPNGGSSSNCAFHHDGTFNDVSKSWKDSHGFICEWE